MHTKEDPTTVQTPLHILRARLEVLAAQMESAFEQVTSLADQEAEVYALAMLFSGVDAQLTGFANPLHQYLPRVRQVLQGDPWFWHLADGGYSRISVSLIDGEANVLTMDFGLSRPLAVARWTECDGGRSASALGK